MRLVSTIALYLLAACSVFAAPMNCAPGTLADYISLSEGCSLGTAVVADFMPVPLTAGSTLIDPALVNVLPLINGFQFSFNSTVDSPAAPLESFLSFNITGTQIGGAAIALTGASATGDGNVLGLAQFCTGSLAEIGFCSGSSVSLTALATADFSQLTDQASFNPAVPTGVLADFILDPGPSGTASLTSATLTFTSVPEPASCFMAFAGLAGMFILLRRKQSTND